MSQPKAIRPSPMLSVVIPAYNARDTIGEQIDSLCRQPCPVQWELVVVDNLSTDDTGEIVRSRMRSATEILIVEANNGRGAAYARNVGAAAASGRWLAFCDADDVAGSNWLTAVAKGLEQHEFVTGPLDLEKLNPHWLADSRGRRFADSPTSFHGLFPYASSCNLAIHRSLFEAVEGFDEDMAVGEDIDISLRLWRLGVNLRFEPTQFVHYRLRPSLRAIFKQSRRYAAIHPSLLEQLRKDGLAVPSRTSRARSWAWLVANVPIARTRAGRARWLWVAGTQLGWFQGGARVQRLYL